MDSRDSRYSVIRFCGVPIVDLQQPPRTAVVDEDSTGRIGSSLQHHLHHRAPRSSMDGSLVRRQTSRMVFVRIFDTFPKDFFFLQETVEKNLS